MEDNGWCESQLISLESFLSDLSKRSTNNLYLVLVCSDDGEYESRLSQSKLLQLCEYDPIMTFVKACDHLLYQTLVEILIPDVLRPIPGMVSHFSMYVVGSSNHHCEYVTQKQLGL